MKRKSKRKWKNEPKRKRKWKSKVGDLARNVRITSSFLREPRGNKTGKKKKAGMREKEDEEQEEQKQIK